MRLSVMYEDVGKKANVLLIVHPNFIADLWPNRSESWYLYFEKVIDTIRNRLSNSYIVIVTHMPLWGESANNEGHSSKHSEYIKFIDELNKFKSNKNFYLVNDSSDKPLCNTESVIDVILNNALSIEVGGGYESSCLSKTVDAFKGIVPIKYIYSLIFDYEKRV